MVERVAGCNRELPFLRCRAVQTSTTSYAAIVSLDVEEGRRKKYKADVDRRRWLSTKATTRFLPYQAFPEQFFAHLSATMSPAYLKLFLAMLGVFSIATSALPADLEVSPALVLSNPFSSVDRAM